MGVLKIECVGLVLSVYMTAEYVYAGRSLFRSGSSLSHSRNPFALIFYSGCGSSLLALLYLTVLDGFHYSTVFFIMFIYINTLKV